VSSPDNAREAAPRLEDQAGQSKGTSEVCPQPDPTTTTELSADTSSAIAFLRALRPGGPWVLWAKQADGPANECRTFGADEADALARWIAERNAARWNCYYHPNPTRGPTSRKASKADIAAVEFLHADLDPRAGEDVDEERARILRLLGEGRVPEPTAIVSSGGGYNALWRLDEPVPLGDAEDAAEVERYTRGIEALLADADSTHNVDRVLRLPGTVNWPDERKRRRGRTPVLAEVVAMAAGAVIWLRGGGGWGSAARVAGSGGSATVKGRQEAAIRYRSGAAAVSTSRIRRADVSRRCTRKQSMWVLTAAPGGADDAVAVLGTRGRDQRPAWALRTQR